MSDDNTIMVVQYASKYRDKLLDVMRAFDGLRQFIDDESMLYKDITEEMLNAISEMSHLDGVCEGSATLIDMALTLTEEFIRSKNAEILGVTGEVKH